MFSSRLKPPKWLSSSVQARQTVFEALKPNSSSPLPSPRKDQHLLSPVNCWYLVLNQTRRESRDHATLNDIYTNNVIVRLSQVGEDVIRLFKKVRPGNILKS